MSVRIEQLTPTDHSATAELIKIYQEAIDPSEQKTVAEVNALVSDPRYIVLIAQDGADVVGFAMSVFLSGASCWLLEYMAVRKDVRGGQVGERLFKAAYDAGRARDPDATMLLEVDQPGGTSRPGNDTMARYRFYKRMRCQRIMGLDYILPLDTGLLPPPMMLLTFTEPPIDVVGRDVVRSWLEALYTEVYQERRDDPRIVAMLSQQPSKLGIQAM